MAKPRISKVAKPTSSTAYSSRTARQRSKFTSGSSNTGPLRRMVDEVTGSLDAATGSPQCDETMQVSDWVFVNKNGVMPVIDIESTRKDPSEVVSKTIGKGKGRFIDADKDFTFPIMQLPTEIRLEMYRACLTRPKKIMLSKPEKPTQLPAQAEKFQDEGLEEEVSYTGAEHANTTASRSTPGRNRSVSQLEAAASLSLGIFARAQELTALGNVQTQHRRTQASLNNRSNSLNSSSRASSGSSTGSGYGASILPYSNGPRMLTPASSTTTEEWESMASKQDSNSSSKSDDPLVINILRASKEIYKEARDVLYSENIFEIDLDTALNSLAALHQRSRRHIKHIELEIPTYTEILERFSEVVRLSLRYCTGLKTLVIRTPFTLPGADGNTAASNTTVYANGFDILRWLPQQCQVVLDGCHNPEIDAVVSKHLNLARTQDKVSYASRMFKLQECDYEMKTGSLERSRF